MIRKLAIFTLALSAGAFAQSRTSRLNLVDQQLVGEYQGEALNMLGFSNGKGCTVSFQYSHEFLYSTEAIAYYLVSVRFDGENLGLNFLEPQDFDFYVAEPYLMNFYPNNDFVVSKFLEHRRDYGAIRLKFKKGSVAKVQVTHGHTGNSWSAPDWTLGYTCRLQ
jgi:hypothetical protein